MIKCSFCHTHHVANTIFCTDCGQYMLKDKGRETDPLKLKERGWLDDITDEFDISSIPGLAPRAIRLKIGDGQRQVEAPLDKTIHMGRVDPMATVYPDVDLTEHGDLSKSVSRRHARILMQDNNVVIEDLSSINGTFINGERLAPYLPKSLSDGDILQLGMLLVEVEFVKAQQRV